MTWALRPSKAFDAKDFPERGKSLFKVRFGLARGEADWERIGKKGREVLY